MALNYLTFENVSFLNPI